MAKSKKGTIKKTGRQGSTKAPFLVQCRGDVAIDWLIADDDSSAQSQLGITASRRYDEKVQARLVHGGAWFVASFVRSAIKEAIQKEAAEAKEKDEAASEEVTKIEEKYKEVEERIKELKSERIIANKKVNVIEKSNASEEEKSEAKKEQENANKKVIEIEKETKTIERARTKAVAEQRDAKEKKEKEAKRYEDILKENRSVITYDRLLTKDLKLDSNTSLPLQDLSHAIWELSRYDDSKKDRKNEVYRIRQLRGYIDPISRKASEDGLIGRSLSVDGKSIDEEDIEEPTVFVLEDMRKGFFGKNLTGKDSTTLTGEQKAKYTNKAERGCVGDKEWNKLLKLVPKSENSNGLAQEIEFPLVVGVINEKLPFTEEAQKNAPMHDLEEALWWKLQNSYCENTIAVVSAKSLRQEGANISDRISWERTAQDFVNEVLSHPSLKHLTKFRHLIVRFGINGAIHCFRKKAEGTQQPGHEFQLYYDPRTVFRDPEERGHLIGTNSVFVASIIREIAIYHYKNNAPDKIHARDLEECIGEGIRVAIKGCQKLFRMGYGKTIEELNGLAKGNWVPSEIFSDGKSNHTRKVGENEYNFSDINEKEIAGARVPEGIQSWSILSEQSQTDLDSLSRDIVVKGLEKSLNVVRDGKSSRKTPMPFAPVAQFGKLLAVDRKEIEGFRSMYNLMTQYTHDKKQERTERPLSIAVFGPPGSGKSFGVKEIAKNVDSETIEAVTYNVAQWTSPDDLREALINVRNISMKQKLPLVLFDEFDCEFEERPLGWLKYFLGPMEDAEFAHQNRMLEIGSSIFIFAGGTSHTYLDFCREDPSYNEEDEARFSQAKGVDFVSRLRGHMNVVGVNRVNEFDHIYVVRRALRLRSFLEQRQLLNSEKEALIDKDVVKAMLKVSSYKHGARSMRAILHMCDLSARHIEKCSLPTLSQLGMHVDAEEFLSAINESRGRRAWE